MQGTNPVAWWPLGANLLDRVAARNGSIGGGSEVHAGSLPLRSAGAFDCAGTNWISVAHAAALKPAVGSVMVWFKPASIQLARVLSADASGLVDDHFTLTLRSDGSIDATWQRDGGETVLGTGAAYYTAGQIVNAIATWDGDGVALYLDGNRILTSSAHTSGLADNTLPWEFGHWWTDAVFDGVIAEIALWNRVLSRNEIYLLAQIEAPS